MHELDRDTLYTYQEIQIASNKHIEEKHGVLLYILNCVLYFVYTRFIVRALFVWRSYYWKEIFFLWRWWIIVNNRFFLLF